MVLKATCQHVLFLRRVHGEAMSAGNNAVRAHMLHIILNVSKFAERDVWNADEIVLSYRQLPL